MRIIGMSYSTKDGERKYTLEVSAPFDSFYKNTEAGRNAIPLAAHRKELVE